MFLRDQLELGNILIQFNRYSEAKEYFAEVKRGQTDPALLALCDAAIVTALHLEGKAKEALQLCASLPLPLSSQWALASG